MPNQMGFETLVVCIGASISQSADTEGLGQCAVCSVRARGSAAFGLPFRSTVGSLACGPR